MSLMDVERLETRLEQIANEKNSLKEENQLQRKVISDLKTTVKELEDRINSHPMPYGQAVASPIQQEGQLVQYQDIIKRQTFQLSYLEQTNNSAKNQLTILQSRITELQCAQMQLSQANEQLNIRLQQCRGKQEIKDRYIEKLNKTISDNRVQKMALVKQTKTLRDDLEQEKANNIAKMTDMAKGVLSLHEFLASRADKESSEPKDNKEMSQLLELQQQELYARNEEITRLRTILDGNFVSSEDAALKNTIKHLRGTIAKYNVLMKSIIQKQTMAEQIIKKYEDSIITHQTSLKETSSLQKQNAQLKTTLEVLVLQKKELSEKLSVQERAKIELKKILVEVLTENQCYHLMMSESYGEEYKYYINKYKEQYLERMKERVFMQRWANVNELIEVNEKLRKRLKLI